MMETKWEVELYSFVICAKVQWFASPVSACSYKYKTTLVQKAAWSANYYENKNISSVHNRNMQLLRLS